MSAAGRLRGLVSRVGGWLPTGRALPPGVWARRHRVIVAMLWGFVPIVPIWSLWQGDGALHAAEETLLVLPFAILATGTWLGPRWRAVMASFGLLAATGVLVHLSDGLIEMHFLYFIMVGIITLYQDWRVFGLAVAFVAVQHGVVGVLDPHSVYNHEAAQDAPWTWAGIHAAFILAMSAVGIVAWKLNEELRSAIEVSEERFRGHFEHAAVGEAMVARDGTFVEVNPALCSMLGYSQEELLGLSIASITHPEDRDRTRAQMDRLLAGDVDSYDLEKRYVRRDGDIVHCVVSVSVIHDQEGRPQFMTGVVQDVTGRKRAQEALEHQALHDALTGLPNRTLVVDRIAHALVRAARGGTRTAVLFIDIDRFKGVNDSLGHSAGDDLLVVAAGRLQEAVRPGDTVARFGGDEFIVLCEGLDAHTSPEACAQRILDVLAVPWTREGRQLPLTASIGVAVARPGDGVSAAALLTNADAAMYRAKDRGRNRFELFDATMRAEALTRLDTEAELRSAFEQRAFVVHYQPLISLPNDALIGVEALVRWEHPNRGLVGPTEFVPLLEELGLIGRLGDFVLAEVARTIGAWNGAHPDRLLGVAINISPRQVADVSLAARMRREFEAHGLDPRLVCLELTETALLEDLVLNAALLDSLRSLGVEIAVDDFGTGYSSLTYLKRLPVDVLKVDRSFIEGVGIDKEDTAIVRAVIGLARTLGMRTIAEGVERDDQLVALRAMGCDAAQGFYWTPARSWTDLEEWIGAHPVPGPAVDDEPVSLTSRARSLDTRPDASTSVTTRRPRP